MNELDDLAVKYGTDKSPQIKHGYTPYYYNLLKGQKDTVKKILEIGVGEGPSLRMWRDFLPNAKIYGADNQDNRIFQDGRIEVFKCDQSSKSDLIDLINKTGTDIDIVIDDGSHIPEHQVFTCLTLMPLLDKSATYIIEDVADPSIVDKLIDYDIEVPSLVNIRRRYDDRLVIVRNKR